MRNIPIALIAADTVVAQNTDILSADVQAKGSGIFRLTVVASTAVKIRVVPSSGSAWYLRASAALPANGSYNEIFAFDPRGGRTFNLQTDDVAGTTIQHLAIVELPYGA